MHLTAKQLFGILTEEQLKELNRMAFEKLKESVESLPEEKLHAMVFRELKGGLECMRRPDMDFIAEELEDVLRAPLNKQIKLIKDKLKT